MTTVRKATGITASLLIFIAAINAFAKYSVSMDSTFVYWMNQLLASRGRIGSFHSNVLAISFWLLLVSSAVDAIYRDKEGLFIIGAFGIPIIISGCVAIWTMFSMHISSDYRWFWLFYYVLMIVGTRVSFNKLSLAKGSGPKKIKEFLKTPPSKYDSEVSIVDRYVLFFSKAVLLVFLIFQIIMIVVFCIQQRKMIHFF